MRSTMENYRRNIGAELAQLVSHGKVDHSESILFYKTCKAP